MQSIDISHSEEIYSVSRLNREIRFLLESSFPWVWIEGEISNFAAPNSGHWYFSLKDTQAQVRCAMFRPHNRKLSFTPQDGTHVIIKARVSLYEGRGDFQLLVEHMEEAGVGKLQKEFEALKKKLLAAGLFAENHKKSLPTFPHTIGIVTSATGAAIRDILNVLKRRYCYASIIIYPTLVQGELAAANIVNAIQVANRRNECDVLILARGGGSLEDLWPFNEEKVAYAIYHSNIPIISGIGHEIDFTIADFVADLRAPTPSAAAELAAPNSEELLNLLQHQKQYLARHMQQTLVRLQQNMTWMQKHLQQQHPKRRLAEQTQRLDLQEITLVRLQNKILGQHVANLTTLKAKLIALTPSHLIRDKHHQLNLQQQQLISRIEKLLQHRQQSLASLASQLDAISPLATLKRGFAIATRKKDQHVLRDASMVKAGDSICVKLMEGSLDCVVDKINTK